MNLVASPFTSHTFRMAWRSSTNNSSYPDKIVCSFDSYSRFIYPALVSLFIATLYFPPGLGQFLVSELTTRQQIMSLFSNFTWMSDDLTVEQAGIVSHWTNEYSNLFVTLGIYMVATVHNHNRIILKLMLYC